MFLDFEFIIIIIIIIIIIGIYFIWFLEIISINYEKKYICPPSG
jgi:hypothetical protein